jgi:hypothetical protein
MKRIYLCHPLSAPTREGIEQNRRAAARWAAWISTTFRVAVSADWITLTGELEETPENREWGLACDKAHIEGCDELWAVGPRFSSGMTLERQHAVSCGLPTYDLTGLVFPLDASTSESRAYLVRRISRALAEQGWEP